MVTVRKPSDGFSAHASVIVSPGNVQVTSWVCSDVAVSPRDDGAPCSPVRRFSASSQVVGAALAAESWMRFKAAPANPKRARNCVPSDSKAGMARSLVPGRAWPKGAGCGRRCASPGNAASTSAFFWPHLTPRQTGGGGGRVVVVVVFVAIVGGGVATVLGGA